MKGLTELRRTKSPFNSSPIPKQSSICPVATIRKQNLTTKCNFLSKSSSAGHPSPSAIMSKLNEAISPSTQDETVQIPCAKCQQENIFKRKIAVQRFEAFRNIRNAHYEKYEFYPAEVQFTIFCRSCQEPSNCCLSNLGSILGLTLDIVCLKPKKVSKRMSIVESFRRARVNLRLLAPYLL